MGQLKENTNVKVETKSKKQLSDRYTFSEGWYDALDRDWETSAW